MAQVHLMFGGSSAEAVDSYLEYKRIVGDDDGGTPFTPSQYEAYKKRITPIRTGNRLYVSWSNPDGMDCKQVGPETPCFCEHRYRQHKSDFDVIPEERPIKQRCGVKGCVCGSYHYMPMNGTQPVRCRCKHFPDTHSVKRPYKCTNGGCECAGFRTAYTCGCGVPAFDHHMIVETRSERLLRGHPVGQDTIYQAMGGLTGFSSLMDGYMRLDPSGRGAPPVEVLEEPITASDHPFLRANVASIRAHKMATGAVGAEDDLVERMSALRRPGESELDYYERRYQERQRGQRVQGQRSKVKPLPRAAVAGMDTSVEAVPGPSGRRVTGARVDSVTPSRTAQRGRRPTNKATKKQ